jgi:hypothetical protein
VEAIKFRMEQSGLSVKDMEPIIGKSNRVYEVLNRKRPLTLAMIRRLHQSLGIPADVLNWEGNPGNAQVSRQKCGAFLSALSLQLGFMLLNDEAGSFIQLVECDDFRARGIASEKLK